jgi:hypothetical protein
MKRSNELLLYLLGGILLLSIGGLVALRYFSGSPGASLSGNKDLIEEIRDLSDFESLAVAGEIHVEISQGDYALRLRGESNLLPMIETEVTSDGELRIKSSSRVRLKPTKPIQVEVSAPSWSRLKATGACKVRSVGEPLTDESLRINAAGASAFYLALQNLVTEVKLSGASSADLTGTAELLEADLSGACTLEAGNLQTHTVQINATGASSATVRADAQLEAQLSGACHLRYFGNPSISQRTSGACTVTKVGE